MLKPFSRKRALLAFVISIFLNGYFFISSYTEHANYKKNGVVTDLYVKSLGDKEVSFTERLNYTKVALVHYYTKDSVKYSGKRKDIWGMHVKGLETLPEALPLSKVIYDKHHPENYILLDEFNNYSLGYSIISNGLIGLLFIGFWFYVAVSIIVKVRGKGKLK